MTKFTSEENQAYWEDDKTISIIDKNLHQLETDFVSSHLNSADTILDIGCGNGTATLRYARKVKQCHGIERSERFLGEAIDNLKASNVANTRFTGGDIYQLPYEDNSLDAIITQRVLINLPSSEHQQTAIAEIHRVLKPGGRYICLENTYESNERLNEAREAFDLTPIGLHWHNLYLHHDDFMNYTNTLFNLVEHKSFAMYYLLTRVFAQTFASFEGFGADAKMDPVFKLIDKNARKIQELYGDKFDTDAANPLGPIQGFCFEKK